MALLILILSATDTDFLTHAVPDHSLSPKDELAVSNQYEPSAIAPVGATEEASN